MSENKNTAFQTSSRSRRRVKRQRPWLAVPLAILVLLIAAALFFAVRHAIKKWGGTKPTEPATTTEAQQDTTPAETEPQTPEATEPVTTEPATEAPDTTEAADTTEAQALDTTEAAETTGSPVAEAFHLYTPAELLPVPEDISYDFFSDINGDDENGSWWFGGMERDLETGEVTQLYERHAETLDLLDKYGAIYRKNADQKVTYLTFDCGYEYGYTGKILDTLKDKNVKAVFFVAGDFVNDPENYDLLKRMYDEGHVIGSHTDHHKVMPTLSDGEFIQELNELQRKVNNILGVDYQIHYYRPPQGSCSERDLYLARKMDITTVFWSFAYGDYDTQNQKEVPVALELAEKGLHDGCVYLLHAVSSTNAAMLGDLIDFIQGQGYEIRRIDQ
ncbi:MAG: polysaccharide deacetylase family protein [Lachnospiraceae bacterium]|nr:polysaccharide deacetylase family protein [Lachnospiraceae bacterium]